MDDSITGEVMSQRGQIWDSRRVDGVSVLTSMCRAWTGVRRLRVVLGLVSSVIACLSVALEPCLVEAQHPIDVQKLSAEGDHFRALAMYEILPDRRMSLETHIAAAKSAWALGLVRQAAEIFDTVLRSDVLSTDERARVTLSRSIIDFQEERYQEAALFAEKAVSLIEERAPLRGRALLLLGQSLYKLGVYASAEEKLTMGVAEAAPSDRPDVNFALGLVLIKLGKLTDAEKAFKGIPTDHYRAAEAVRHLASISLQTKQFDRARFWIEKGRSSYAEAFLDSWSEFGLAQITTQTGDLAAARTVVDRAQQKFPASDSWLLLMQAALEQAEWNKNGEEQNK